MQIRNSRAASRLLFIHLLAIAALILVGCGESEKASKTENSKQATADNNIPRPTKKGTLTSPEAPKSTGNSTSTHSNSNDESPKPSSKKPEADAINPETGRPRILGDLIDKNDSTGYVPIKMTIDDERVAANGIRKLISKHLTLYTDLPSSPDVDELPRVFDLAVPQWCDYFQVPVEKVKDWKLVGFVIHDKERFRNAELIPGDLPPFVWGYQRGHEFWVYEQPTIYYRRHLLLHEGTHGFMNWHLGGTGPMWFTEGTAELLGTHLWKDGKLTLRYNPPDKKEVEQWGRVKIIQDHFAKGEIPLMESVFYMRGQGQLTTDVYAWCWAVCSFFDQHPRWQQAFRDMRKQCAIRNDEFTQKFMKAVQDDWLEITEQWQLYVAEMEYGYDVARADVSYERGQPLPASGATVSISADRGWQSSGYRIEAGQTYEISGSGRYTIGTDPKPWLCEPSGVTIRYYNSRPLGMLVGGIRDDEEPFINKASPLIRFEPIGLKREIKCNHSGTLFLRINESPASLGDNAGELSVRIVPK